MRLVICVLVGILALPLRAQQPDAPELPRAAPRDQDTPDAQPVYIFYLPGRIVEDEGPTAVSPEFGPYDYHGILHALSGPGVAVVSERRGPDTEPGLYADSMTRQIRRLVAGGVPSRHIAVVGASKGAVIAMLVATRFPDPEVRYVLLGNCNEGVQRRIAPRLHGHVLSIYEVSDRIGQSCADVFAASPELQSHEEIRLSTGLGHGFLYRPLPAWVDPAREWLRCRGASPAHAAARRDDSRPSLGRSVTPGLCRT